MVATGDNWLAEGEKFALLGLDVWLGSEVPSLILDGGLKILPRDALQLPKHWREWLGTTRAEEVEQCSVYVLSKVRSDSPGVLDRENQTLEVKLGHWFTGLQLSCKLGVSEAPFIISGGWNDSEGIDVRSFRSLEIPGLAIVSAIPAVDSDILTEAAAVGERLRSIVAARDSSYWRLRRCLAIYQDASNSSDLLERIHQFARCIEGLILPARSETTKQFKSRTELFVGPRHQDLMGKMYEVRCDIEHMHENKHLEVFDRATRIYLAQLEAVAEWIARSSLRRIVLNPDLSIHFGRSESLAKFWSLTPAERQKTWGPVVDPYTMLRDFNFDHVTNKELGADF